MNALCRYDEHAFSNHHIDSKIENSLKILAKQVFS